MEITDAAVVAQVLAGDSDAFRVLVERHSRSIYRVVYRMTGNQQDAEELVQEVLLRAYKSLGRFEMRSNFSTWLYRIAINRTLDFLSARKTQSQMSSQDAYQIADDPEPEDNRQVQVPSPSPGPERVVLSGEVKSHVTQAMTLLTPVERVAFIMRHMEGRSIEEIGQALNLKASAAKNSVFRAVHKLRQQLEPLTRRSLQGTSGSGLGAQ